MSELDGLAGRSSMNWQRLLSGVRIKVVDFFSAPQSPKPLGIFRVLIAAFALLQLLLWYQDWDAFFASDGWVQWEISRALGQEWQLHLVHVADFLARVGFSSEQSVRTFYWIYTTSLVALLVGWHTRIAAFFAWAAHYVLMNTIPIFLYGVDIFLQIGLFYALVMPVAKACSIDSWIGRVNSQPSWGVTLSRRVLQIHLCLVYMSSGFEKLVSPEWWSGNLIWRCLVQPDFHQYNFAWLAYYPWVAAFLGWFTIAIESGYFAAIWIPHLRVVWMAGISLLHLGIAFFLGLGLFGLIMIVLSLSAFGSEVWRDLKRWPRALPIQITGSQPRQRYRISSRLEM